ncbi:YqeG family HAD IIIA-type phosphatase [Prochlorococcus sp. MIT 1223]|uniref:YqeG family HAD IIIA-type phosphatase n=1 Tax=Prochlorococcus sp. MIT 1223 TaxID=3096217 RepID=UPI002A75954D|nr:YqeG family HAD IIIA-type phosphatase [Prochlorococcus sp. MIT 1223]
MTKNWLKPDWDTNLSIQNLSINELLSQEIKLLLLDVDGTLLPRQKINLPQSIKEWILEAKEQLHIHLLSNNPSKKRIKCIANELSLSYTYSASKPRRGKTIKVIKKFNYPASNIAIIGDRIFTDILIGNRLGIYTILVKPVQQNGLVSGRNYTQRIERYLARNLGGK